MTKPIIDAEGYDGTIRIYDDHVELVNSRFLEFLRTTEAQMTIPRENIGQISYRDAGKLRPGILKIFPTGVEDSDIDINTEPYTIRFIHSDQETFTEVHEELKPST